MRGTVVLWLWNGWRPVYNWRHINAMIRMLRPDLPAGWRIICVSDQPQTTWHPAECEVYPLWPHPCRVLSGRPNCFVRLGIFSRAKQKAMGIARGDLVLSMDADSLVLPGWPQLLQAIPAGQAFAAMGGLAARIHGSLFAFRAGEYQDLWDKFHPTLSPIELMHMPKDGTSRPIGSDQAWMSRKVKGEHLWHAEHGAYSWSRHGLSLSPKRTENALYWSFAGVVKPWSPLVEQVRPDLHSRYMAAYGEG